MACVCKALVDVFFEARYTVCGITRGTRLRVAQTCQRVHEHCTQSGIQGGNQINPRSICGVHHRDVFVLKLEIPTTDMRIHSQSTPLIVCLPPRVCLRDSDLDKFNPTLDDPVTASVVLAAFE